MMMMMMFLLPDPASWFSLCLSFFMIHQDVYEYLWGVICWFADVFEALSHNPLRTMNFLRVKLKSQ
jgi:hypothetical protein